VNQFVYLIRLNGTKHYKIGCCKNLYKRLYSIERECRNYIILITAAIFPKNRKIETKIKHILKPKRIPNNYPCPTEWFKLNKSNVISIRNIIKRGENCLDYNYN